MIKAVVLLLVLNFITCFITRMVYGGVFKYNKNIFPSYNGKMILIAGILGQPEEEYQLIHMPYGYSGYLNYSLLGYNPRRSGKQLKKLTKSRDYVVGLSVGCKSIIYAHQPRVKRVLINPVTHTIALKTKYHFALAYLTPIAEVISYAIGWLAILPIIKTKTGNHYSIALLVDQLFWSYYGDPDYDMLGNMNNTEVIVSTDDKLLENSIVTSVFNNATIDEVVAKNASILDVNAAEEYDTAINNFLLD